MEDPLRTVGVITAADDIGDARAALQREFSLDEVQAEAVLDMQWRRAPRAERMKIQRAHDELVEHLRDLNIDGG